MDPSTPLLKPTFPFFQNIPPELQDLIIDALRDERDPITWLLPEAAYRALLNCTLVCLRWRDRARRYLQMMNAPIGTTTASPTTAIMPIIVPADSVEDFDWGTPDALLFAR